ncbi:serine hydrolase [Caulobacter sp. KR2-114]|uniref:serine hydrolase n=1 Tax=Caulobacter sp. KR2-114 TaxID=3400912 RepID=UPI003C05A40A
MSEIDRVAADFGWRFAALDCRLGLQVVALDSGRTLTWNADARFAMASVFKVLVALELFTHVEAGTLNAAEALTITPAMATAGPTRLSSLTHPVTLSLAELCRQMLSISDNTAGDVLLAKVGTERVNARARAAGCRDTVVRGTFQAMLDEVAGELGFADYAQLVLAREGALGPEACRRAGLEHWGFDTCSGLDPARAAHTTAADMAGLMVGVWRGEAATPAACARLRNGMAAQMTTRVRPALAGAQAFASKTGSLFGRIRHEVGLVDDADGRSFAFAVLTQAEVPVAGGERIEAQMGTALAAALAALGARLT